MSVTREEVIQFIENMTVLELSDFIKALEDKFGVTAAMPVMAAAAGPAVAAEAAAPVEEKTEFNVILTGYEAEKKIQVIKVVRAITSLGLKEAKDLVDGAPKPVKEGIAKKDAEDILKQITEAGGKAELK